MGVGVGGGGGGRYGGRFGGRENLVARGGGTRATESAVLAALKWLARHQGPDGGWGAESFQNQCVGGTCGGPGERDYDTRRDGHRRSCAFLGAGYSQLSKDEYPDPANPGRVLKFGEVVKKGLQWLLPPGSRGLHRRARHEVHVQPHGRGPVPLGSVRHDGVRSRSRSRRRRRSTSWSRRRTPARRGATARKCGDNDSSVSGWAVMALKSAELSELTLPEDGLRRRAQLVQRGDRAERLLPGRLQRPVDGQGVRPRKERAVRPPRVDVGGGGHVPHLHAEAEERARAGRR